MAICKCKNNRCTCLIEGGFGIDVSGNGSDRNPYIADALPSWSLIGSDGENADVNVSGTGTVGDPYVVTITTDGQTVTRTVFAASGTWVNPGAGSVAHVICIGGGGGGAHGGTTPSGTYGAAAGGGGAMSTGWFLIADLPTTVAVAVGVGGARGDTNEGGSQGQPSWFGDFLFASGGGGSDPFQFAYAVSGGGPIGTAPEGGPGGSGWNGATPAGSMANRIAPGGGGRGARVAGATLGEIPILTKSLIGAGGDGAVVDGTPGGDGGLYGGGGGGGAALADGGPGGNGGAGVVIVTTW